MKIGLTFQGKQNENFDVILKKTTIKNSTEKKTEKKQKVIKKIFQVGFIILYLIFYDVGNTVPFLKKRFFSIEMKNLV